MGQALSHLTVIELCEELPAFYCGRQFATWGASVTTVEPAEGSPLRRRSPVVPGAGGRPISLVWEYAGANKVVEPFDLSKPGDAQSLVERVRQANVFITDWPPDRLAAAGLDHASLAGLAPGLVMVSITPFGSDGPYAGFAASDLVVQALSGILSLSGYPDRAPLKVPANILPYACGVSAFVGALAALHQRNVQGSGQLVEIACTEAVASMVLFLRAQYLRKPFPRRSGVGTVMLPCSDGYLICSAGYQPVFEAVCLALGIESEAVPESLRTLEGRQDTSQLLAFIGSYTRVRPAAELFELLGTLHIVCGLVESTQQVLQNRHLAARGWFRTLNLPGRGPVLYPGPAGSLSETPATAPVPLLRSPAEGEDAWVEDTATPAGDVTGPRGAPLAGIRMLDLTGAWIGPYAATLLADLGADVMKIESPRRPDVWRIYRPAANGQPELPPGANPRAHPWNTSFYFNSTNRNKRGLTLDLATTAGKDVFLRLAASADLVLENFTPRVMGNLGIDYETLRAARPDLIMASFSGYGASGPYRDFKATGVTIEAISGWTSLFGYPGEGPMAMGEMEADPLGGLQMAALTLVALLHRDRTGRGQRVEGTMFEAAAGYIGEELLLARLGDDLSHPRGNRDRSMAPQGVFACAGPDEWVAITVRDDDDWRALVSAAGDAPMLHDHRFARADGRLRCVDEVEAAIARWTAGQAAATVMEVLQGAGVPAGTVLKTNDVPFDPQVVARDWFRPIDHPDMGSHLYNGYPWRFSVAELGPCRPPPRVGEHGEAILTHHLGLSRAEFDALAGEGVTAAVLEWPEPATVERS